MSCPATFFVVPIGNTVYVSFNDLSYFVILPGVAQVSSGANSDWDLWILGFNFVYTFIWAHFFAYGASYSLSNTQVQII